MNIMQTLADIKKATDAARVRLNDKTVSTQVKAGKVQVTRVTYNAKGASTVTPVSDWLLPVDAVAYLDGMQ